MYDQSIQSTRWLWGPGTLVDPNIVYDPLKWGDYAVTDTKKWNDGY